MREVLAHPEPTLQTTALRFAAGDLTPGAAAAFESLLATSQDAREALSEAVRLSAAALGQAAPAPHRSFRAAVRERLTGWCPEWLARRAYRGHPYAWAALGACAVVACVAAGVVLTDGPPSAGDGPVPRTPAALATAPASGPSTLATAILPDAPPHEGEAHAAALQDAACGAEGAGHSVAELWAEWSTADSVEKAHDDEMKWRQRFRDAGAFQSPRAGSADDHP